MNEKYRVIVALLGSLVSAGAVVALHSFLNRPYRVLRWLWERTPGCQCLSCEFEQYIKEERGKE